MADDQVMQALAPVAGGGATAAALLLILYKVGSKVFDRMIAALDRVAVSVNDHTAKDLAHHAEVRERVARLETEVRSALDWRDRTTPVEMPAYQSAPHQEPPSERRRREARENPHGYRSPRPGHHHDE